MEFAKSKPTVNYAWAALHGLKPNDARRIFFCCRVGYRSAVPAVHSSRVPGVVAYPRGLRQCSARTFALRWPWPGRPGFHHRCGKMASQAAAWVTQPPPPASPPTRAPPPQLQLAKTASQAAARVTQPAAPPKVKFVIRRPRKSVPSKPTVSTSKPAVSTSDA